MKPILWEKTNNVRQMNEKKRKKKPANRTYLVGVRRRLMRAQLSRGMKFKSSSSL